MATSCNALLQSLRQLAETAAADQQEERLAIACEVLRDGGDQLNRMPEPTE